MFIPSLNVIDRTSVNVLRISLSPGDLICKGGDALTMSPQKFDKPLLPIMAQKIWYTSVHTKVTFVSWMFIPLKKGMKLMKHR